MSSFNEAEHPRHSDGKWAAKQLDETDPELGAPTGPTSRRNPAPQDNHNLLRGLPAYIEVTVTTMYDQDKPCRLMARDLPRGEGTRGLARRYTNLDSGMEWFIAPDSNDVDDTARIASVTIDHNSFTKNWPDAYSGPYGMDAHQVCELIEHLHTVDDPQVEATVVIGDFPDEPGFERIEGVRVERVDLAPADMDCPAVYVTEQPGEPPWAVPITHLSGWEDTSVR